MSFSEYLSSKEISNLVLKAVSSDLVLLDRALQLQGISKPFVLGLTRLNNTLDQFQLDLISLNSTERLADGQVPLVQFLRNAANQLRLRGRQEAEDFERAANSIGNSTLGVPKLPDPAQLPEVIRNEAIIGVDDMVDFRFLAGGVQVGSSVARLIVPRFETGVAVQTAAGAPWTMVGTAWMIAPTLMLTNHHVIRARLTGEPEPSSSDFTLQAGGAVAEFDFDQQGSVVKSVAVTGVEANSIALDYAVLRLQASPARPALKFYPQKVVFGPASYLPVNIIQHPRGLAKRVAFRNNLVTGADGESIRYFTDTDSGSSGSPVCDDNWRVVALHRGAEFVKGVTFQGKSTAYVNFGSQVQAVLEELKTMNPIVHSEIQQFQN